MASTSGGVELDVQSLHHVAGDARKQTADELGHLDHGDVVQDAVDGHAQGAQQQHHTEHRDHAAVVQLIDLAVHRGLRLIVGVGLQAMAADEEGSYRTTDEGTHYIAQSAGGDAHGGGGLGSTPVNEDGAEGGGGAHAAGHGGGGALESQEGVEAHQLTHQNTDHVLKGNEQAGSHGDHDAQLAAGVADELPAEAEAHAHEEDVLAQVLDSAHVERDGDEAAAFQQSHHDGKQQTGDHRGGDGEFPQQRGALDDGVAQENDDGRKAQAGQVLKLERADCPVHAGGVGAEVL